MRPVQLYYALNHTTSKVDYTYESHMSGINSIIDHIIVTESLVHCIHDYNVEHLGINMSDHSVVYIKLDIPTSYCQDSTNVKCSLPMWHLASTGNLNDYAATLDFHLQQIHVPLTATMCRSCICSLHNVDIHKFYEDIVNSCLHASSCTIPHSRNATHKVVPGWNEHVSVYKEEVLYWHKLWKLNNSPISGDIADMRKKSRSQYHYILRQVKKHKDKYAADKMANAMSNKDSKTFWNEVNKLKCTTNKLPASVGNAYNAEAICSLFQDKYDKLYNTVSYNSNDMNALLSEVNDNIYVDGEYSQQSLLEISSSDIKGAISHLKHGKNDGYLGHYTDHLINGPPILHDYLAMLFNGMVFHG